MPIPLVVKRVTLLVLLFFLVGLVVALPKIRTRVEQKETKVEKDAPLTGPAIVNGELVLPKIDLPESNSSNLQKINRPALLIVSANLIGIYSAEQGAGSDSAHLAGIRMLGEVKNSGSDFIGSFTPVVRFIDAGGATVSQKIAHNSVNYDFFGLGGEEQTVYDITVDDPPPSDRMEIVFSAASASASPDRVPLKILNRSTETIPASISGKAVDTYSVRGSIINTTSLPVADMTIVGWLKNEDGKVYGIARQDFKSDLLSPGQTLDFHLLLLPVKTDEKFSDIGIAAWGKEYILNGQ